MEAHKQKRILHAAQDLFGQFGFKRVAIDEIAKKAGVSKGTVYNFAESKDDLYFKVVDEELRTWVTECAARRDPNKTAEENLLASALFSFEYLDKKPTLKQLLIEDIDYSLNMWVDRLDHIRRQCAANCTAILEQGKAEGTFRSDLDSNQAALVLNDLMIHALVMKYKRGPTEALLWSSASLDLILRGIRAPKR